MILNVPLALRVGDQHITREVESLNFRKEAVGGVRNITFKLSRPIAEVDGVTPLAKVYVYDARTAECVAQGRVSDAGRSANASGQSWDVVAFGPIQHMSDITSPIVYIDRSISDGWRHFDIVNPAATIGTGTKPNNDTAAAPTGILALFGDGIQITTEARVVLRYDRMYESGQTLGGFQFSWVTSHTTTSWLIEAVTRTDAGVGETAYSATFSTAGGSAVVSEGAFKFPTGRNTVELRIRWTGGATTTTGETWGWFDSIVIRPRLLRKDGTLRASIYHESPYILAHDVIEDVLARWAGAFDAAGAVIDETGDYRVTQLAYPDGVNAEQVFADLMRMNPSHRWYATPDTPSGKYGFRWEQWSTAVRYEVGLDDGGSFPLSTQSLYNAVTVRWVNINGITVGTQRTMPCEILDNAGVTRRTLLDLGSEVGSVENAIQAGDAFLAEHNAPKNAGTLNVSRPIRDVITGAMVDPHEIEPGELIRVRGVDAYPDALNAADNDGRAVFRIFAVDYSSDDNTARLELDTDPRDTAAALANLMSKRTRR